LVAKSFKKCSISNNLDGSDGNFTWYSDNDQMKTATADDDDNNGEYISVGT
jgi:hypothetical protein